MHFYEKHSGTFFIQKYGKIDVEFFFSQKVDFLKFFPENCQCFPGKCSFSRGCMLCYGQEITNKAILYKILIQYNLDIGSEID